MITLLCATCVRKYILKIQLSPKKKASKVLLAAISKCDMYNYLVGWKLECQTVKEL